MVDSKFFPYIFAVCGGLALYLGTLLASCSSEHVHDNQNNAQHEAVNNELLNNDLPDGTITCVTNAGEHWYWDNFVYDFQINGKVIKFIDCENRKVTLVNLNCAFNEK